MVIPVKYINDENVVRTLIHTHTLTNTHAHTHIHRWPDPRRVGMAPIYCTYNAEGSIEYEDDYDYYDYDQTDDQMYCIFLFPFLLLPLSSLLSPLSSLLSPLSSLLNSLSSPFTYLCPVPFVSPLVFDQVR